MIYRKWSLLTFVPITFGGLGAASAVSYFIVKQVTKPAKKKPSAFSK